MGLTLSAHCVLTLSRSGFLERYIEMLSLINEPHGYKF